MISAWNLFFIYALKAINNETLKNDPSEIWYGNRPQNHCKFYTKYYLEVSNSKHDNGAKL